MITDVSLITYISFLNKEVQSKEPRNRTIIYV